MAEKFDMKFTVFMSVVMLLGSAQWQTVTSVEIMRNIHLNEATAELYQGDMVLTDEQRRALLFRKAIKDERYRWNKSADGTVNIDYRYNDTVVNRTGVLLAMSRWEQATCVKFNEVPAQVAKPHLIFITDSAQCSSSVGQIYSQNGQYIRLKPSCFNGGPETVVHELGHALGLWHEQSRSDRDDYLYIMFDNIIAGMEHNFNKEDTNNYGLPYDYSSRMQYIATALSKNGLNTIVAKDPLAQPLIQDRGGLSFMDKKIVNLMYNCTVTWLAKCNLAADPCKNQGYTKSNCSCECPAGTSGANCETLNQTYTDALIAAKSPGSQRITTPGTVTSPGYPTPVINATSRVQSIVAPECHKVRLTFNVFDMEGYSTLSSDGGVTTFQDCWYMTLEIKLNDPPIMGTRYCGTNITATQTFESVGRIMVLTFSTRTMTSNTKTGYSATVAFVPVTTGNCTNTTTTPTTISTTTPTTTSTTTPTTTSTTTLTTTSTTTPTTTPTTTTTRTSTTTSTTTPTTTTTRTSTTTPTTTSTTTPTTTTTRFNTTTSTTTPTKTSTTTRTTTSTTTPTKTSTTTPTKTSTTTPTTTPTKTSTTRSNTTTARPPCRFIKRSLLPLTPATTNGQCSLVPSTNPSIYFYRSPNYPSNYSMGQQCTIWFNTTEPRYLMVTPQILELGPSDSVDLFSAYNTTTYLDACKVGTTLTLPTSSSRLTFQVSPSSPGGRFEIVVEVINTGCHQLINLNAGSTGPLSTPANYPPGTVCEWWLRAPAGRKVQVAFSHFSIGPSTCLRDSVVIDVTGDTRYVSGSKRYCGGNTNSPGTVVSTGNAINILVNGLYGNYGGLDATYTVV